jgi:glycosyltransferase involved in cell wall biosynthesis
MPALEAIRKALRIANRGLVMRQRLTTLSASPRIAGKPTCDERRPARRIRLVVLVTHPIQYYVPLYRALACSSDIDLTVVFCSRLGLSRFFDAGMGIELSWNMDLLSGYESVFLPEAERLASLGWRELDTPSLSTKLDELRPDVVLIHGYARKPMLRALLWCRYHGVPAMMSSDSSSDTSRNPLALILKRIVLPVLLQQYGALLTMSQRSEEHYMKFGVHRERLFRVPTMIDDSFWRARMLRKKLRAKIRAELSFADADFVIAYVGKLYDTKRVGDIIEALARLGAVAPKLLVIGDGRLRTALERLAAEKRVQTHFAGFVNADRMPEFYSATDVLVHPAELEQYGMIAVEAAVIGLPLILSDRIGAIGETSIARPGENTVIYPCGDIDRLAAAVGRLADEPDVRTRMGEASLRISAEHEGKKSVEAIVAAARSCLAMKRTNDTGARV